MKILSIKSESYVHYMGFRYGRRVIYFEIKKGTLTTRIKRILSDSNTFSYKGKRYKVKLEVLGNE